MHIYNYIFYLYIYIYTHFGQLFKAAVSRSCQWGAVVFSHNHKRGSERCMKWRKMADHVQVSRGFMFLHQTIHLRARK